MEKGWSTPAKRALLERIALQYQSTSRSHKQRILARFMTVTGSVRKYAMWVLNHAEEVLQTADAPPQRYGSEEQQALVLAWETLNRICAKRLIPFLPDMIESLEQNGHLQLSEENRRIVLSMSAATADRLLRAQRLHCLRSLSTTKARPLLKQQIPMWVFFDTGITVSEACALHVADLDPQTGRLRVRGKGGKERQMALGSTCQSHLRAYLKHMDQASRSGLTSRCAGGDPLFGSQGKQPLTKNGVTMVFARFRKRAGIGETPITPQILRHSFALRYLQVGGNPQGLQELLGYEGMAPVRQYLRWSDQVDLTRFWMVEEEKFNRESKIPFYIYVPIEVSQRKNVCGDRAFCCSSMICFSLVPLVGKRQWTKSDVIRLAFCAVLCRPGSRWFFPYD